METSHFMTVEEVAALFRVDPETVRRWARAGKIPSVRLPGGQLRFRRSDLPRIGRAQEAVA